MSQSTMPSPVMRAPAPAPVPLPNFTAQPRRGAPVACLLACCTAVLLWASHFPLSWGFLAWVAFVPLLCLVRLPQRFLYLSAYGCGVVFFGAALQWMRVADARMYVTWIALALYLAVYFPLALYFLRVLVATTPLPLTLTFPVVWTALEWFRSIFVTGFGWYMVAHTQHDYLPLIQISDITGAYGVTFVVAAVNGLLFEALWRWRPFRTAMLGRTEPLRNGWRLFAAEAVGVSVLLAATLAYGWYRLGQDQFAPGPRVALLQGNIDQRLRNEAMLQNTSAVKVMEHYVYLSDAARAMQPHLIVWPETSCPYDWVEIKPGEPAPSSQAMAAELTKRWQTPVLLGLTGQVNPATGTPRRYNSAVLIDSHGQAAGRYDKMHLVVFGEYVPLREWLPFMKKLAPYDFEYSVWSGESFTRFPLSTQGRELRFGVVICFEDTDPDLSGPYTGSDGKPAVDFLLNISNDGWFDGTSQHDEHLAICRFRAVECRRAVGRSVNMGISALIDGNGRVLAPVALPVPEHTQPAETHLWKAEAVPGAAGLPLRQWQEYKKVHGVLLAVVPLDERHSFYARWGDWLPWSCGALLLIVVGCRFAQWRAERNSSPRLSGG